MAISKTLHVILVRENAQKDPVLVFSFLIIISEKLFRGLFLF